VRGNQLQGKELSFNNLVDLTLLGAGQEFTEPAVIIVKHTNPCGAATGAIVLEAYQKALAAIPVSAFGSVIGINRTVDADAAAEIAKSSSSHRRSCLHARRRERFAAKRISAWFQVHSARRAHRQAGLRRHAHAGRRYRPRRRIGAQSRHLASATAEELRSCSSPGASANT